MKKREQDNIGHRGLSCINIHNNNNNNRLSLCFSRLKNMIEEHRSFMEVSWMVGHLFCVFSTFLKMVGIDCCIAS